LYFDHNFYVNSYNNDIDYFFLDINSFKEEDLKEIFQRIYKSNRSFQINAYYLLEEETSENINKATETMRRVSNGKTLSWNSFCRNLVFKIKSKGEKKKAYIQIDSSSLGDNLAWVPYVEEFRAQNDYEVYCFSYLQDLYVPNYPKIKFLESIEDKSKYKWDKEYGIGWYNNTPDWVKQEEEQRAASYYLELEHKELRPKVFVENTDRNIEGKYVCISVQSTSQCKYWNNPTGWDQVIEYLNSKGIKVVCIDKHSSYGGRDKFNYVPDGAINKTGDFPLQERATDLYHCEFFIGLGSGLSWLAWGLEKDVILISGFSNEKTEFNTPYRVINKDVCNSCWNRHEFDAGNWNWCPDHEGTDREFECSKQITFEMVKEQIDKLI
jgi:autotransporter strand-loop-strand O-heptosyltransferase